MRTLITTLAAATLMSTVSAQIEMGLDVLLAEQFPLIEGKRVGIVCNHTAVAADGRHIGDILAADERVTLAAMWGPEHGIRGDENAGARIQDVTGEVPIYSLYDQTRAPTSAELEGIDVMIYDIQDVGARFYTYISTMGLTIEACAANGVPVIILERPNPVSGLHPAGPLTEPDHMTFVGHYPIPIRYSLTDAELAQMAVAEGWIDAANVDMTIIPCRGWSRSMQFDDWGREFIPPSPNIPNAHVSLIYLATCYYEGTNVSEGRGTDEPFRHIGAPFINGEAWAQALAAENLPGVTFEAATFTPMPNAGSSRPKLNGEECHGVTITVTDPDTFQPIETGLAMLFTLAALHPDALTFRESHFDRLWGTSEVRNELEALMGGADRSWRPVAGRWAQEVDGYWDIAAPHRLHD